MTKEVKMLPKNFIKNGAYQKIYWLGVSGYIIANELDKEILLIDPWPSYIEFPSVYSPKIVQLANWLVKQVQEKNYTLVGIIGTHEHFDHIADIPVLYNILNKEGITLPPFYSDEGTLDEIKSRWMLVSPSIPFTDIVQYNSITLKTTGQLLYYDDKTQKVKEERNEENYPLKAGTKLNEINIGKFLVTPYIWDHSSTTTVADSWPGVKSGNYQRCTAIFLKCKNDLKQKSLFLVGSAGEMNELNTGGFVNNIRIETDILIQSMPHRIALLDTYFFKLIELIAYQMNYIQVNDKIIATHFENFIDWGAHIKKSNYINGIEKNQNQKRITAYTSLLDITEEKEDVPEKDRVKEIYYMRRFLIEYTTILLSDNYDEKGKVSIEEKKDGDYWLRFSTVGYF